MDIIKMARELGAAIQQDERYLNFKKAREANEADKHLNDLIGELNLRRKRRARKKCRITISSSARFMRR